MSECPRFRQVLPHARAVTGAEHEAIWKWAADRIRALGLVIDESCRDASRLWFLPVARAHYEHRWIDGEYLDVDGILLDHGPEAPPDLSSDSRGCQRGDPFDQINAMPMRQVARALGLDPDNPTCPWCRKTRDAGNSSQIEFGFGDTNLFKCHHAACSAKSTHNVGLIAKVVCGVDDARKLPKRACRQILDWARTRLGLQIPNRLDTRTGDRSAPEKANAVLIEILRSMKLGRTSTGLACGVVNGQLAALGDRAFRSHVASRFYSQTNCLLPGDRLEQAAHVVLGEGAVTVQAPIRFADHDDAILIDLVDRNQCVRIRPGQVDVTDSPIPFLRPDGTLPLPLPVFPANVQECQSVLSQYRAMFPGLAADSSWASALAWLLSAARPSWFRTRRTGYVILRVKAEKGAGKTSQALYLSSIIDPRAVENDTVPDNTRDVAIIAEHTHVFVGDNVSRIIPEVRDALCMLALGMGFRTRSLYTDAGLTTFVASRPIIITSITDVADRDDLFDRSIRCEMIRPRRRVKDEVLASRFRELHPRVLGAVAWLLSRAMNKVDALEVPAEIRMQSAAVWAIACEQDAGLAEGTMVSAFRASASEAADIVTSDPAVTALLSLVTDGGTRTEAASDWYDLITDHVCGGTDERGRRMHRPPKGWPDDARGLRKRFDRLIPSMRALGFTFTAEPRVDHTRPQTWTWARTAVSPTYQPPISRGNQPRESASDHATSASTADSAVSSHVCSGFERNERGGLPDDDLFAGVGGAGQGSTSPSAVSAVSTESSHSTDESSRLKGTADSRLNPGNQPLPDRDDRDEDDALRRQVYRSIYGHDLYEDASN